MKYCAHCDTEKEETEFNQNPRTASGLSTYCAACTTAITREWKQANPERVAQQQARRRARLKEAAS